MSTGDKIAGATGTRATVAARNGAWSGVGIRRGRSEQWVISKNLLSYTNAIARPAIATPYQSKRDRTATTFKVVGLTRESGLVILR